MILNACLSMLICCRVEHLMEKERVFKERFVQNKSSLGSDEAVRRKSTSSGTAMLHMLDSPKLDTENMPLSHNC